MNLAKSYEWFQPESVTSRIHIIGCGSVGSTVAELLTRFGLTKMSLYDFDTVNAHNVANQMFVNEDIHKMKVDALKRICCSVNPDCENDIVTIDKGYVGQKLSGYVFLCVDNIDLRRKIVEDNMANPFIKAMFDFRTRLTDAQHYAVDWSNEKQKQDFLGTMQFSHEEAAKDTPMSACHVSLCVAPTVRLICNAGVANFVNFVKEKKLNNVIVTDAFSFMMEAI